MAVGANILRVSAATAITVNPATVLQTGTTGGAHLGVNTDYWWDNDANRTSGARSLRSAIADMGAKFLRYHGGEKSDGYLWSTTPFSAPNPQLARVSSAAWPSYVPLSFISTAVPI